MQRPLQSHAHLAPAQLRDSGHAALLVLGMAALLNLHEGLGVASDARREGVGGKPRGRDWCLK